MHAAKAMSENLQRLLSFDASLGTITRYLLKHSSAPVFVLPPVPELPDATA
jgi:hypothetical protein